MSCKVENHLSWQLPIYIQKTKTKKLLTIPKLKLVPNLHTHSPPPNANHLICPFRINPIPSVYNQLKSVMVLWFVTLDEIHWGGHKDALLSSPTTESITD